MNFHESLESKVKEIESVLLKYLPKEEGPQKVVLEETKADKILNISVTEGYMFTTVKSNCFILILSKDVEQMNLKHDCSKCNQINCKLRDLQVEDDINAGSKY